MKTIKEQHIFFFTLFWDGISPPVSTELAKLQCLRNRPTLHTSESKLKCLTCIHSSTVDDIVATTVETLDKTLRAYDTNDTGRN